MFQSFPLGDRSSVNSRGDFHLENITTYDTSPADHESKMDVDAETAEQKESAELKGTSKAAPVGPKADKTDKADKPLDAEALYPLFWSLQESFSQPLKLFDTAHFAKFKHSLAATMTTFEAIPNNDDASSANSTEASKQSLKRKRSEDESDLPEAFNPKYLTSKDLFTLEVNNTSSWLLDSLTFSRSAIFPFDAMCLFKPSLLWSSS